MDKPGHGQFPMRELVQQIHVCPMLSWMYTVYCRICPEFQLETSLKYPLLDCYYAFIYIDIPCGIRDGNQSPVSK